MIKYIFLILFPLSALANITVFPTAAHFDVRKSVSTVSVKNSSNAVTTYSIEAIFYVVGADGKYQEVADTSQQENSLVKLMRFSPKKITLRPNEEQVVRIMVKKDRRLKAGDYRAHVRFSPIDVKDPNYVEKKNKPGMYLDARVAVSIPGLLRLEPVKKEVVIDEFRVLTTPEGPRYSVRMTKGEGYFPYGEFRVTGTDKDGNALNLALVKGVQSFNKTMTFNFPFTDGDNFKKAVKATLLYVETFNGAEEKIAEKSIAL